MESFSGKFNNKISRKIYYVIGNNNMLHASVLKCWAHKL